MSKPKSERYTVAVDFDGVIHAYTTPWINAHTIPDKPIPGAIDWLDQVVEKFDVVIFSTRCKTWRGRRAIRQWLRKYWREPMTGRWIEAVRLSYEKPPALIYIDDRAFRFEGRFPSAQEIHQARPWKVATPTHKEI